MAVVGSANPTRRRSPYPTHAVSSLLGGIYLAHKPPEVSGGLLPDREVFLKDCCDPWEKEMNHSYLSLAFLLLSAPVLQAQPAAPQTKTPEPKQPVYLYLYADVADQINLDITEDRLRHLLPMLEHYRLGIRRKCFGNGFIFRSGEPGTGSEEREDPYQGLYSGLQEARRD